MENKDYRLAQELAKIQMAIHIVSEITPSNGKLSKRKEIAFNKLVALKMELMSKITIEY